MIYIKMCARSNISVVSRCVGWGSRSIPSASAQVISAFWDAGVLKTGELHVPKISENHNFNGDKPWIIMDLNGSKFGGFLMALAF